VTRRAPADEGDLRDGPHSEDPLARYVIDGLLGSGGRGRVYRARDTLLQRVVALKWIEPREGDADGGIAAALHEARAAAAIHHPNVATVFDAGATATGAFIVMEHVAGTSLRALMGDAGVSVATRLRWLAEIAGGLDAAHVVGVAGRGHGVQRDVPGHGPVSRAGAPSPGARPGQAEVGRRAPLPGPGPEVRRPRGLLRGCRHGHRRDHDIALTAHCTSP
jgi:Protein kinase domain